ncbi:MAG: BMP family ABC transporter substrate-binding protein [Chloroflexi bacterium]|nr:BMP family ABC transporter substrate-binding protein [Chloroflexota bacterium]
MSKFTSLPLKAAFLFLLIIAFSACAFGSIDGNGPNATPAGATSEPPPSEAAPTQSPTVEPPPTAPPVSTVTVGFVARAANAPAGSIPALSLNGMQLVASTNSALFQLDLIEIEALDSADPEAAIAMAVGHGDTIIVVAGADLAEVTRNAAQAHPEATFVGVDQPGDETLANYYTLGGPGSRLDQEGFVAGALAGYVTQERIVGLVVVANTLEGKLYTNGFTHGLRYACGDCKLWTIELENTTDLETGAGTAARLKEVKADVIFAAAGEAGNAGLEAAAAQGTWVIGLGQDEAATLTVGADKVLNSVLRRPDLLLPSVIMNLLAGTPPAKSIPFDLANGLSLASNFGPNVSPAVAGLMDELLPQLASGFLDTGVDPATGEVR